MMAARIFARRITAFITSQQEVLVALAADFVRYLTFKSEAHLTLEGHADRRGAVEYNQHLTERRVERTKTFLVEHGVPAANIETRALGKQQNMDTAAVKQLVDNNPDLTPEERQKIDANLLVIVMANNRRVDVSLDTTGQQSVRQYPFNAKDSLTLLSTKGTEGDRRATPPAQKKPPVKPNESFDAYLSMRAQHDAALLAPASNIVGSHLVLAGLRNNRRSVHNSAVFALECSNT
jgi:hypothetical protein